MGRQTRNAQTGTLNADTQVGDLGFHAPMNLRLPPLVIAGLFAAATPAQAATVYYVDALRGDDRAAGTSPQTALRTLEKASRLNFAPGDELRLAADQTHPGSLTFANLAGTALAPIVIHSYAPAPAVAAPEASTPRAIIDARGQANAVHLRNARHVVVRDLVLQADGGGLTPSRGIDASMRCGVRVDTSRAGDFGHITLQNLHVRDVFFEEPGFKRSAAEVRSANGTQRYGWGIRFIVTTADSSLTHLTVQDCRIENTGHTGIKFTAPANGIRDVRVLDNLVERTGGPGIQLSGVTSGLFRGNRVDHSGHSADSRQWGRGSGLWTWSCTDILIEHNRFTNAQGPGDSAGCHIDYNCRNVVIQYNVSANNAGGFCEILGNNFNCAYRYNLSVNDGHRVKGRQGAFQEGKILWLSGYIGDKRPPTGPFNSYIYNNTIHTSADLVAKVAIASSARGILIANNIFHLQGESALVSGDQNRAERIASVSGESLLFSHNLFLRADNWPAAAPIHDAQPIFGDPGFPRPGGLSPSDYIPSNAGLVRDRGLVIAPLPGDAVGLALGLSVPHDLLGRPIQGRPDLGAIELP